jgi:hypothetical protein
MLKMALPEHILIRRKSHGGRFTPETEELHLEKMPDGKTLYGYRRNMVIELENGTVYIGQFVRPIRADGSEYEGYFTGTHEQESVVAYGFL